jgi:2-methylcitrate dehydratase PrpD
VKTEENTSESGTRRLARFSSGLVFGSIPPQVVEAAKFCILDTVGCALYAASMPWSRIVQDWVAAEASAELSSIWGSEQRTSPSLAALANGTAAHGFEIDDVHSLAGFHPGSATLPAVLAVAEAGGKVSGSELLTAVVAGYEAGSRVGLAMGNGHFRRGFHPQGTVGSIAACAGAARLLGLDVEATVNAFGVAGSIAAGLMAAQEGGMVKRFHAGRASQNGVVAAQLAQGGFIGTANVLEAEFGGFFSTLGAEPGAAGRLVDGLGDHWETLNVGFKIHASSAANHTTLDAVAALRDSNGLAASDVESVLVETTSHVVVHGGWDYIPRGTTNAQMSLKYGVAVMLVTGDAFIGQFTDERVRDPDLVDLASRVDVVADPEMDGLGATLKHATRVTVHTRDGRTLSAEARERRGGPKNPITREEIVAKYRVLAAAASIPDADSLLRTVMGLEASEDITELLAPLRRRAVEVGKGKPTSP